MPGKYREKAGENKGMQNKAGFSLIEVMIVIAIIAIASAYVVPNLLGWISHQGLRSAVVELQSDIQSAKMSAVRQNQDCSINVNTASGTYRIPCLRKTVLLNNYRGGLVFMGPGGEATAGVLTLTSRGLCTPFGSIYLTNRERTGYYRVQVLISGGVVTSKWDGVNWR